MAGRSGGGSGGVYFLAAVLIVVFIALMFTSFFYYMKFQSRDRELTQLRTDREAFVAAAEAQNDEVQRIVQQARSDGKSAIGFLMETNRELASVITGSPRDSMQAVREKLAAVQNVSPSDLLGQMQQRNDTIAARERDVARADEARARANADLQNEIRRGAETYRQAQQQLADANSQIDTLRGELDNVRQGLNRVTGSASKELDDIKARSDEQMRALNNQVKDLVVQNNDLRGRLREAQERNRTSLVGADPEEALVDGRVLGVDGSTGTVTINRGRRDRVKIAMTFGVYSRPSAISPDASGAYSASKARIEVITVNEDTSVARIVGTQIGQAVLRDDVIANAVYDPNKVYTFVVFGNFDANGDGVATPLEADEIRNLVREWGGKVSDTLAGDVDFLVLGERPIVPPAPNVRSTEQVIAEWERVFSIATEYDRMFEDAKATFIPVLNQNRFYTLIGKPLGDIR